MFCGTVLGLLWDAGGVAAGSFPFCLSVEGVFYKNIRLGKKLV